MKRFLFILLFASGFAHSQTVQKVSDSYLVIASDDSEKFEIGSRYDILGKDLEHKGSCEISKVSGGGRKAICRLESGTAEAGMAMEKSLNRDQVREKMPEYRLSDDDRKILEIGEIEDGRYYAGGAIGTFLGLGTGHAVQGRYGRDGWIFTAGEVGSAALVIAGVSRCVGRDRGEMCAANGLTVLGIIGVFGFRIWEIIDLWAAPSEINRRYRHLKSQMGSTSETDKWKMALLPNQDGLSLGLQIGF
jgi:hypothetical protein